MSDSVVCSYIDMGECFVGYQGCMQQDSLSPGNVSRRILKSGARYDPLT